MSYRIKTFRGRILRDLFTDFVNLDIYKSTPSGDEEESEASFVPFYRHTYWGKNYDRAFFLLKGVIPEEWKGCEVRACINAGGETLVLDEKLNPIEALTDASVFDPNYKREIIPVTGKAKGGEEVSFYLECTANGLFGMNNDSDPDPKYGDGEGDYYSTFRRAFLGVFNREVYELYTDMSVLDSYIDFLGENDYRAKIISGALEEAWNLYVSSPGGAVKARAKCAEILKWKAADSCMKVTAIGHAHIDTAWLWPIEQTMKKCVRTFAGQIALMKRYRNYTFGASSAFHYEVVKSEYPKLYEQVKKQVAAGRWEVQGGMYVEADCNITGGESLARQFLYGKNFFFDEFGIDVKNLWLPDVFGYPGSLPQIIKAANCDYFLTQKISWSDTNKFPYHSFYWKGIDGTEVLTHFPPEDTYNAYMTPRRLLAAQDNFSQPETGEFMSLYGIGDGGGGPSADFVERALRLRNFEGSPKVEFGRACDFFDRLAGKQGLPEWSGELYLELHRGTLTTQARNKRRNRKAEEELALLEALFATLPPEKYPDNIFDNIWKTMLINQFHDIIPGSSVHKVYEDSTEDYAAVFDMAKRLRERFNIEKSGVSGNDAALTVVNSLSFPVLQLVDVPWSGAKDASGKRIKVQDGKVLLEIPAAGSVTVFKASKERAAAKKSAVAIGRTVLENELVRYEFNDGGQLISAFDKEANSEFLSGRGNVLSLYADYPAVYEAWDVDKEYVHQKMEEAVVLKKSEVSSGDNYSCIKFSYTISSSTIEQRVTLRNHSRVLEFETEVEWNEVRKMLRVGFESNVVCDNPAYDIQYGYIRRVNNRNTSWERAKFEVCCHKYVDLSERHRGLAVLNDCKYGCRVEGGFVELGLLRATKHPDFYADLGSHRFTYALMVHPHDLIDSNVIEEAASLNRPAAVFSGDFEVEFPARVVSGSVAVTCLKKALKSDELVVRMVETRGVRTVARVEAKANSLVATDLAEMTRGEAVELKNGVVDIPFKPFEIKTFFLK